MSDELDLMGGGIELRCPDCFSFTVGKPNTLCSHPCHPAPPQDGDEIETAFKAVEKCIASGVPLPGFRSAIAALATIHRTMEGLRAAQRRHDQETTSIHSDMLALGHVLGVPYDGLKSPAGYLHADIMPAIEGLRAERDAAREDWHREADEHVRTALRCRGCEEAPVGQHTAREAVSDNELAHPGLSSAEDGVTAANRPDAAPPQDAPQPLQSVTESAPQDGDEASYDKHGHRIAADVQNGHNSSKAQDGDEIETAFETVHGYLPDRDGRGVSANAALAAIRAEMDWLMAERDDAHAALATIHRTMEGLREERDAAENALVGIKELHIVDGRIELQPDVAHEVLLCLVEACRQFVNDAPNYMWGEVFVKAAGESDGYTLTVRKPGGEDPHTLRMKAEAALREATSRAEQAEADRDRLKDALLVGGQRPHLPDGVGPKGHYVQYHKPNECSFCAALSRTSSTDTPETEKA